MSAAQKRDNDLFQPSSRPAPSIGTIFFSFLSIAMIVAGFYIMSAAFSYDDTAAMLMFSGGIALDIIAFMLIFMFIPARDKTSLK
ncbi:hypothetical protein KJY78_04230 [Canibacter sp. lx-45]|uniref:hypothetical protein n=1 Tax=Canibacter zhuwentaonis TaxID=2837491 RepID=UPI001BDC85C0|nr:hypothetical protein [Canibacter zhuwentaonis]MBT1035561.1 hypothetical protein [Canibacter zhuwentaonis]